jgi:hypothetical protein
MVDLNGHEAGNGGYSQGTPTAHRPLSYSERWTINASTLSEVVRQLRLDRSDGFNSGTLSIEPFGGSRCRGVLATTYAFSMVFLGRRKSGKHPLQRNEPPKILV